MKEKNTNVSYVFINDLHKPTELREIYACINMGGKLKHGQGLFLKISDNIQDYSNHSYERVSYKDKPEAFYKFIENRNKRSETDIHKYLFEVRSDMTPASAPVKNQSEHYFELACYAAQAGSLQDALDSLSKAFMYGFRDTIRLNNALNKELQNIAPYIDVEKLKVLPLIKALHNQTNDTALPSYTAEQRKFIRKYVGVYHVYYLHTGGEDKLMRGGLEIKEENGVFAAKAVFFHTYKGYVFTDERQNILSFQVNNQNIAEHDQVSIKLPDSHIPYTVFTALYSGWDIHEYPCSIIEVMVKANLADLTKFKITERSIFDTTLSSNEKFLIQYLKLKQRTNHLAQNLKPDSIGFQNITEFKNYITKQNNLLTQYDKLKKMVGSYHIYEPKSDNSPAVVQWLCIVYEEFGQLLSKIKGNGHYYEGKLRLIGNHVYFDFTNKHHSENWVQIYETALEEKHELIGGCAVAINTKGRSHASGNILHRQKEPFINFDKTESKTISLEDIDKFPPDSPEHIILKRFALNQNNNIIAEQIYSLEDLKKENAKLMKKQKKLFTKLFPTASMTKHYSPKK